jgi:transposase
MLGPVKSRDLDRPVLASLESLVPAKHFYRRLEQVLDLSFVRDWVAACYAESGRPSVDPVIFFKLQIVMLVEGIRSERKLIELASLNLAHRWYVGYCLDEPLPDHSTLTRIRQRLGLPIFRRFFEHIVDLCDQAGLVWGKELFFDATKVQANAALESLKTRFAVDEHLRELFATDSEEPESDVQPEMDEKPPMPLHPAGPAELEEQNADRCGRTARARSQAARLSPGCRLLHEHYRSRCHPHARQRGRTNQAGLPGP